MFENVSFSYPGNSRLVLDHLDLRIDPGERIALIGENGQGKTTIVKLITRLYDPTAGRILLDGVDLREYGIEDLHREIGVIFQDFMRYEMSARRNIAVGRIDARFAKRDIRRAAQKSLADEVIRSCRRATSSCSAAASKAGRSSGGEWQKIALARAYLRDAQLLILDEPTAALDARSEYEVFQRFAELTEGKMALLISHRFSTVRMADRIVVLENGRIAEQGQPQQSDGPWRTLRTKCSNFRPRVTANAIDDHHQEVHLHHRRLRTPDLLRARHAAGRQIAKTPDDRPERAARRCAALETKVAKRPHRAIRTVFTQNVACTATDGRWLIDNDRLILSAEKETRNSLLPFANTVPPVWTVAELSLCRMRLPKAYLGAAMDFFAEDGLRRFPAWRSGSAATCSMGEFWALKPALSSCCIERIAASAQRTDAALPSSSTASAYRRMPNWKDLFESVSIVDTILVADPPDATPRWTTSSRDATATSVTVLQERSQADRKSRRVAETAVADCAVRRNCSRAESTSAIGCSITVLPTLQALHRLPSAAPNSASVDLVLSWPQSYLPDRRRSR